MKYKIWPSFILAQVLAWQDADYPRSQNLTQTLYTFDQDGNDADMFAVQVLAGVVARFQPQIYLQPHSTSYANFLQNMQKYSGVQVNSNFENDIQSLFDTVIANFNTAKSNKFEIVNFVDLDFDTDPTARNLALTYVSGRDDTIVCSKSAAYITPDFCSLTLGLAGSTIHSKNVEGSDDFTSIYNSVKSGLNLNIVAFQPGSKFKNLGQFTTYARAACSEYDSPSNRNSEFALNTNLMLSNVCTRGSSTDRKICTGYAMGWGPEYDYVDTLSKKAVYVYPSDWVNNLPALINTDRNGLITQAKHPDSVSSNQNVHTIAFIMSDGDNVQWLLNDWSTSNNWYGAKNRGTVPITWTISPGIEYFSPNMWDSTLRTQTENDDFITGPSGGGYTYLNSFTKKGSFAEITGALMKNMNLKVINVISGSNQNKQADYVDMVNYSDTDAIIYYPFNHGYAALGGYYYLQNSQGKQVPVLSSRWSLWDNGDDGYMMGVDQLVQNLLTLPKGTSNSNAYSIIPVHAWSHNYDDVIEVVNQLNQQDPNGFDFVTISGYVKKFNSNFSPN